MSDELWRERRHIHGKIRRVRSLKSLIYWSKKLFDMEKREKVLFELTTFPDYFLMTNNLWTNFTDDEDEIRKLCEEA